MACNGGAECRQGLGAARTGHSFMCALLARERRRLAPRTAIMQALMEVQAMLHMHRPTARRWTPWPRPCWRRDELLLASLKCG